MALNYTYIKYKDKYTIENTGSVTLTYHVSKVTCDATTEISTGTILSGQTTELKFVVDGVYSVYLASISEEGIPFLISYYNNLLVSFISSVEGIICGCSKCDDCEECNKCEDYLGTFMKAQAFNFVNANLYQSTINQISSNSNCLFTSQILCSLLNEKVYGSPLLKDAMISLISFSYLGFYFKDLSLATDAEEAEYITTKYKFEKIANCLRKVGIIPINPLED